MAMRSRSSDPAISFGATSLFFQSLPDFADFDANGNSTEPNPFGPLMFQDTDADPDVFPFGFSASLVSGTDVTVRQGSSPNVVPEPATLSLLGLGIAVGLARRMKHGGRR